jgi:hypothetical protein
MRKYHITNHHEMVRNQNKLSWKTTSWFTIPAVKPARNHIKTKGAMNIPPIARILLGVFISLNVQFTPVPGFYFILRGHSDITSRPRFSATIGVHA